MFVEGRRFLRGGLTVLAVLAGDAALARADELVMPFACAMERGEVTLTPAGDTRYALLGNRDEQPFGLCAPGGGDCTTIMVHRFMTQCAGERVAWARVAAAGPAVGVALPPGLPHGYAPVSGFRGRFVLPALVNFSAQSGKVASEALSAEGVIDRNYQGERAPEGQTSWRTVVRAEIRPEASFTALRVAAIATVLVILMLSACVVAAGRWRMPARLADWRLDMVAQTLTATFARIRASLSRMLGGLLHSSVSRTNLNADPSILNALAVATARLAETELLVSTLPRELLLREVLVGEVDQVRERLGTLEQDIADFPAARAAATVGAAMRELERIGRIAHGAARDSGVRTREHFAIPGSLQEAYQLLGINADAAPQVAKKLVDALRMSWHPDFARDEEDRNLREARMKQINAAWDLIKDRRAAA